MWTTASIKDQTGKSFLVTGANSGVGYETALALYKAGAHVILAGRDIDKLNEAQDEIRKSGGTGNLEAGIIDLARLASVREFAGRLLPEKKPLHALINNAGVMMPPEAKTEDGFELQFGVNFIGHFVLTALLFPLLQATPGGRVVTVSSRAYNRGHINFDNLRSERDYDPVREYAQSKLADLMFAIGLQQRLVRAGEQVVSIAAQPGANNTALVRHMSEEAYKAALERFPEIMEPWQGALPSLLAATDPTAVPGALYGPHLDGTHGYPVAEVIDAHALDQRIIDKLWNVGEGALGAAFL